MLLAFDIVIGMVLAAMLLFRVRGRGCWPEPAAMPFVCEECQRGFKAGSLLAMHLRSQHHQMHGPLKQSMDQLAWRRKLEVQPPAPRKRRRAAAKRPKLTVVK